MTIWKLEQDDILNWCKRYDGPPAHAILCDPPYHLVSQVKRFGSPNSKPPKGDVYKRAIGGMMGQVWDGLGENGKGIAFDPDTWAALAEHLHPGGFGMSFASARGWHRMACAIEDAGMILHPSFFLFGWNYLSGFPKATRVKGAPEFDGHRYGGQCIKPALEPIIVFQRPYEGRPVDSIVATGAGALWIDGGRIEAGQEYQDTVRFNDHRFAGPSSYMSAGSEETKPGFTPNNQGRWPANFTLTCCCDPTRPDPAVHQENCPVRLFDEQAGEQVSGGGDKGRVNHDPSTNIYQDGLKPIRGRIFEPDSGPASRMFHRSTWQYEVAEALANAEPVRYEPKASSGEREAGLSGFDEDDVQKYRSIRKNRGSGYDEASRSRNPHPTVKPISLTKYLATLLLPPAAYAPRRILVPFAGVGSEAIGAILAGWDEVIGVEQGKEYCEIAEARLKWWSQWPGWGQTDVGTILEAANKEQEQSNNQLPLFKAA